MTDQFDQAIDAAPFVAKQFWATPQDYEIWWEDPRDIYRVTVSAQATAAPALAYWRSSWPRVRVPKGAVVGAGESGWLANDDWTNGDWQAADCLVEAVEGGWVFTFQPLNRSEFPQYGDFPAEFRRTLKLRLSFPGQGAQVQSVSAQTDSTWREATVALLWSRSTGMDGTVERSGRLEAFNGQVLAVKPLNGCTQVDDDGGWQSRLDGAETETGVAVTLRHAYNEDPNSFDRTILTLRSSGFPGGLPGVSFLVDEVLQAPVYVRALGVLARDASADGASIAAAEAEWQENRTPTLYDQIFELPEQTWEQSWEHMPRKTSRMYFTLGCEGSRQKFGLHPNGDIFMTENFIRRVAGRDTVRLGWEGYSLRLEFGFPSAEPGDRSLLDGYLPIIRAAWLVDSLAVEQEAYATWLRGEDLDHPRPGDDPVIAMMQARFTNLGGETLAVRFPLRSLVDEKTVETLQQQDGWVRAGEASRLRFYLDTGGAGEIQTGEDGSLVYTLDLPPGTSHALTFKIPHVELDEAEQAQLLGLDFAAGREEVADFWRQRTAQGAQIHTPNETVNNFYRSHLMHMLVINDREPGTPPEVVRNVARCGGFAYGSYPDEGCMAITDLDRRGYHTEARRCLELYLEYQGTAALPGNFQSKEGVFYGSGGYEVAGYNRNHGWVLWCLAEHYRYTRDRAWLTRIAPALVQGCEWIMRERQATLQQPGTIQYGFLPSGSLEDVTDYWTWLATNAYAAWGFRAAAKALAEIDHPEADRIGREAAAFDRDLRAGFFEAAGRSPVVRLRDGTWVPHFPARQERRGRDFGWLRELLEGPCHLIYCGLIAPDEAAAGWIIQDYEDNLFLSEQYGYQAEDFERQWFHLGGFSMQSNLLLFPPLYLWRDQPKHYLRGYFNAFTSAFFPDTATMCEHALPDLAHWRGDHFKSSDEANSNGWLRSMFVDERGEDLYIGQAVPRDWLRHGAITRAERMPTHFGEVSAEFISEAAVGVITARLDPPRRNPPQRLLVRVRHPQSRPMRSVWVNGQPHAGFDPVSELISLEPTLAPVEIRICY
jgi:hypothetical protein